MSCTACRMMFLVFCLLPTMLVAGWTAAVHSPSYRTAQRIRWERELAQLTGLTCRLERVARRRDGRIELGTVRMLTSDDSPLLVARQVSLRQDQRRWRCDVASFELQNLQLPALWEAIEHRALRNAGDVDDWQFDLRSPEARVLLGGEQGAAEQLVDCQFTLQSAGEVRSLQLLFAWQDPLAPREPKPGELVVMRSRSEAQIRLKLLANAGLPARLLSSDLRELAGDACRFRGQAHAVRQQGRWSATMQGDLHGIDLARLAPSAAPLSGEASLRFSAKLIDGHPIWAIGRLTGGAGAVSLAALLSLPDYLGVQVSDHSARMTVLDYGQLSMSFELNEQGFGVIGDCPGAAGAILLTPQGAPMLHSRRYPDSRVAHHQLLQGLSYSGAPNDLILRRAPYPPASAPAARTAQRQ